jgi:hypothetical protein
MRRTIGMSVGAARVTTTSPPSPSTSSRRRLLVLALALGFVLGCRLLLYAWMPDRNTDFDALYQAAARFVQGDKPYPLTSPGFPDPLPAVLVAVPFTVLPLGLARLVFDVLVGWAFVYALWKYRGAHTLLAVLSGAYLFALREGQTTPLMVASSLIPALSFLLAIRPNTSLPLWIARPSWIAVLGVGLFVLVSLVVMPSWPREWWLALPADNSAWVPPVMRPFGFLVFLAALRWRLPEGRLLLAMGCIPQSTLPYELVPMALIPANHREMVVYLAGSWIAATFASPLPLTAEWGVSGWPVTLCVVYLPMLYLVLRRPSGNPSRRIGKERRRPHRLSDHELRVDVTPKGIDGFTVRVTHLPTRLSASDSGQTREIAARKAHDRLAAMLAERSRTPEDGHD